ncbi:MAG: acetyl-CoA carboxylase carboxyltransferase subunit alpha [Planctomycetota bacterium]|jgi:acetyl-CoA carboxylase carboxyl transferase subunit alpha|nr:acetyl-CoA carboxylase carboxyltransferase subunit alpha [Planctomycetota bacterium]
MNGNEQSPLPFESPLSELKQRIDELLTGSTDSPELRALLKPMQEQYAQVEKQLYDNLKPWQIVMVARHPGRPQTRDYTSLVFDSFEELHGDRMFADDLAIVTGLASIGPHRVMLIGQHRGRDVHERHLSNAGCPHPEGYRKALRKMKLAEKFGLPVVTLVDTKGAYPGIGSEERGVAVAIAENLREMSRLRVPVVSVIIGEGGSGGALGIGVGDRILMLRYAYYSVISPEGCASILWRDGNMKAEAAEALRLTSHDLLKFKLVDAVVDEPLGGAHRDLKKMGNLLRDALISNLDQLVKTPLDRLLAERYQKFRRFGEFLEVTDPASLIPALNEEPIAVEVPPPVSAKPRKRKRARPVPPAGD